MDGIKQDGLSKTTARQCRRTDQVGEPAFRFLLLLRGAKGRNQGLTLEEEEMGLVGVLTVIFVVAKLGGYLDWSWWIVFSPVYISVAFAFVLFAFAVALRR